MQEDQNGESTKKDLLHRTIWWLKDNYCYVEGISIPRQNLYENYQSYCKQYNYSPISTATFGKIIRQQFPQITTRRLGVRGHSKYHYHGLAVKETSIYYDPENLKHSTLSSLKIFPAANIQHPKNRNDFVPKIQFSIELPKSSTNDEKLNSDIGKFFIMYQTHSQQIIDSIVHGSFEEIGKYLYSFWRSCPDHFTHLFDNSLLIDGIIIIDVQVYIAVYRFVLHSMNQSLPDLYLKQFVTFLTEYSVVLSTAISANNYLLRNKKIFYALMFKQMCLSWLRGSHLYQIIFPVLSTTDFISQILEDFQTISLENVIEDVLQMLPPSTRMAMGKHFYYYFEQFENMLEIDFSFDSALKWIQNIFRNDGIPLGLSYKDCFLTWSTFFSKFLQELFLTCCQSFAQVNLIFLWLEHLFYTESMMCEFETMVILPNKVQNAYNPHSDSQYFQHPNISTTITSYDSEPFLHQPFNGNSYVPDFLSIERSNYINDQSTTLTKTKYEYFEL